MAENVEKKPAKPTIMDLPRNVWAVSLTSFFLDVSSEMVINILPLFLANVLGVQTSIIGLIEGIVGRIQAELEEKAKVVAAGGLATLIVDASNIINLVNPDLTLIGLRMIWELNRG